MVYLVPFLCQRKSPTLLQIWLFLERNGTHLIALEEAAAADPLAAAVQFLEENELSAAGPPFQVDGVVFAPVDPSDPELVNFYTWRETPAGTTPMREVWRPFLWYEDEDGSDSWGINRLLESVVLGEMNTGFSILQMLRTALRHSTETL